MGLGSVLDGLLGEVSGRVSDVEGKISKLRTAKSKIEHEQAVSLKEIEHIKSLSWETNGRVRYRMILTKNVRQPTTT